MSDRPAGAPSEAQYWVRLFETESNIALIREALDTHSGAALSRHAELRKAIEDIHKMTEYYGDQLVKVYHDLNKRTKAIEYRLDELLLTPAAREANGT